MNGIPSIFDNLDFDAWADLARQNPDSFEQERSLAIEGFFHNAHLTPVQLRRLRGLQFQVDSIRTSSHTPLQACMRISSRMWDAVDDLRNKLNDVVNPEPFCPVASTGMPAKVIPFTPRRKGPTIQ